MICLRQPRKGNHHLSPLFNIGYKCWYPLCGVCIIYSEKPIALLVSMNNKISRNSYYGQAKRHKQKIFETNTAINNSEQIKLHSLKWNTLSSIPFLYLTVFANYSYIKKGKLQRRLEVINTLGETFQ